jgi:hypothetical protein
MFFRMSLYISLYRAMTNFRTVQNTGFNVSADFLLIFHDEMNRRFFYTIMSPGRTNSHSPVQLIQYLHFL